MEKKIPLSEITQYLDKHPRSYVIISHPFTHIIYEDFSHDVYWFNDCKELQLYIEKYNINNYKGDLSFTIFENTAIRVTLWLLHELKSSEKLVNSISFNLKVKDIHQQLLDFYRYICLDANQTNQWLITNLKELNESTC